MKASFVLASTGHGPLIVNRNDRVIVPPDPAGHERGYGVGFQLLETGFFDPDEVKRGAELLQLKRRYRGVGVVAVDVGANIGVMTVTWARLMEGWGSVHAFECQERLFYALCGNIALNNLGNAHAYLGAMGTEHGVLKLVDRLDFDRPGSYGSMSLIEDKSKDVGQEPSGITDNVWTHSLDTSFAGRVDLVKVDVEGMEEDVLIGGHFMLLREHPILIVEHLKSDKADLRKWLEYRDYVVFEERYDLIGVHRDDPCLNHVKGTS